MRIFGFWFFSFCRALCRDRIFPAFSVVPGTLEPVKYNKNSIVLHENRGSLKLEKRGPGVDLGSILKAQGHNFHTLGASFGDLCCILEQQKTSRVLKSNKNGYNAPIELPGGLRRAAGRWGASKSAQT